MQRQIARPRTRHADAVAPHVRRWVLPRRCLVGTLLVAAAWTISWTQVRPFAQFYFFPIWLGYILVLDGCVLARRGTSLLEEGARQFVALFLISAIFWWTFEALNIPVQNWRYLGVGQYSRMEFAAFATLPFSTVLPAVLETASLFASFLPPERYIPLRAVAPPARRFWLLAGAGIVAAIAPWAWPQQAYPLIWSSLIFVLEPVNWFAGRPSTFRLLRAGDPTLLFTLFAAGVTCGFFWEMWNYYSYPKWAYVLPGVTAPKLFEMPIPGYLGYFPFALELYAMYNVVLLIAGKGSSFERVLQLPRRIATK
jgi:hypothetical protein